MGLCRAVPAASPILERQSASCGHDGRISVRPVVERVCLGLDDQIRRGLGTLDLLRAIASDHARRQATFPARWLRGTALAGSRSRPDDQRYRSSAGLSKQPLDFDAVITPMAPEGSYRAQPPLFRPAGHGLGIDAEHLRDFARREEPRLDLGLPHGNRRPITRSIKATPRITSNGTSAAFARPA